MTERAGDGLGVDAAGIVLVHELGLPGEREGVEPLKQWQIMAVSTESVLGSMLFFLLKKREVAIEELLEMTHYTQVSLVYWWCQTNGYLQCGYQQIPG